MLTRRFARIVRHSRLLLPKSQVISLVHTDAKPKTTLAPPRASSNPKFVQNGQNEWKAHEKQMPELPGRLQVDLAKEMENEQEYNLFPSLTQLQVSTANRSHSFSTSCDQVIKFIKLGAINKYLATQYCHYLAHLVRESSSSDNQEDVDYYNKRALDLMSYLLRKDQDLTKVTQIRLICDIANSTASNCSAIINQLLDKYGLMDELPKLDIARLLASCYKFQMWHEANTFFDRVSSGEVVNMRLFDPFIMGLLQASEKYISDSIIDKEKLRDGVLDHLFKLIEGCRRDRIQFITKYPTEFKQALENFRVDVEKSPEIKMSGRCTRCGEHLPLYDPNSTQELNRSIKDIFHQKAGGNLYIHLDPEDRERFETFMNDLYRFDKKPIDCVIDGLNVAYRNSVGVRAIKVPIAENVCKTYRSHDKERLVQVLVNTIIRSNVLRNCKKILLIGKGHMRSWPGLFDFLEANNIHCFTSKNNEKDDLLQLYAATLNPRTILMSNDFYRDHIAMMQTEDRIRFERWLDTHQAWTYDRTLKPVWPTPYEKIPSVNKETGCFHIPVIDYHKLATIANHEPPPHLNNKMLTWLCCRR